MENSPCRSTEDPHDRKSTRRLSRTSAAVQTAISSLGDQGMETYVQAGISRVKAMGNNDEGCNTQSPVVVEPGKNANTTGWSTNSYHLPDLNQNMPTQYQQCMGPTRSYGTTTSGTATTIKFQTGRKLIPGSRTNDEHHGTTDEAQHYQVRSTI